MQHFIVIGNPINHSKSPQIHHAFADSIGANIRYCRQFCPDDVASFRAVVEAFFHGGGTGANITLPFKEIAFQLCQSLSEYAYAAKAVNTLIMQDGKLHGDNTDGQGLVADLNTQGIDLKDKNIAIIGAGGATRGIILPLIEQGAKLTIFNRTLTKAETLQNDFKSLGKITVHTLDTLATGNLSFDIIINATSATTTGQTLSLSPNLCTQFAYDMMYGKPSAFLNHFAKQGVRTSDGYGMLINQAKIAFELWTGAKINLDAVDLPINS